MTDKTPEELDFDKRYTDLVTKYGMIALKITELEEELEDIQAKYSTLLLEHKAYKASVG
jgi:hypothetical protein